MDLGRKLRDALRKISGKPYVDEAEVKALIKEIQRVLISSDVNIKLVFELSKRIEKNALDKEKMKDLSLKEHVIKVVYDELTGLMGEEYTPRLDKHKILVCGLFGSGKCVHKDTKIPLANGEIKTIKEIYDGYKAKEQKIDDGYIINSEDNGPEVYSFNRDKLKIEKRRATKLWKLKKDTELVNIKLDNGNNHSIITTPEHPFFTLENGKIKQIRADGLEVGSYVATAGNLNFSEQIIVDLKNDIKEKLSEQFKIEKKENQLVLRYKRKGSGGKPPRSIKVPIILTKELAEFLGYVFGDGYSYKNYIEITNNDDEVLNKLLELGKKLFGITGKRKTDKRNGVRKILFSSKTLLIYLNKVFGLCIGKKSKKIKIPTQILKSPNKITKYFIRSYFDTDGYVGKNSRHIEFCSSSEEFLDGIRILLLRFGIFSNKSLKVINGGRYHRLFIKSRGVEIFADEICSIIPRKIKGLKDAKKIGEKQGPGKQHMIYVGNLLKEVRESRGISIGELQKHVSSYGIYEAGGWISKDSLRKYLYAIDAIKTSWLPVLRGIQLGGQGKKPKVGYSHGWMNATLGRLSQQGLIQEYQDNYFITEEGKDTLFDATYFSEDKLETLKKLVDSDVCWIKVKKIKNTKKEEFVYDLTIDDLHTFIANGIVVHNTTTIGKLAHYYKTKGMKVGVVGADCDRPAAKEQLEQLAEQAGVNYYTDKEEKNSVKIVKNAVEQSKDDVLIVDSAGRSAFDEELSEELRKMNGSLNPEEVYLVVSADIGQIAGKQTEAFKQAVPISGVIVTKLEGSGKGGGALSAVSAADTKIAFIGTGEKLKDLEIYSAERFVGKLLGIPDIKGLIEKVREVSEGQDLTKLDTDKFTIKTFYEQLKATKKMGPMGNVMSMMGLSDALPKEAIRENEGKLKLYEAMINSMTDEEKEDALILRKNLSRIERVANGSGTTTKEVRQFLAQFEKLNKLFTKFKKDRGFRKKLEKMMQGGNFKLPDMPKS